MNVSLEAWHRIVWGGCAPAVREAFGGKDSSDYFVEGLVALCGGEREDGCGPVGWWRLLGVCQKECG